MEQLNPIQNIAIDLIILGFDKENEVVKLYAPERDLDFLKGKRALPGVLLKHGESISDAVERAITTKTPLKLSKLKSYHLQELPAQTNPDRDPRGHVVSIPILVITKLSSEDVNNDQWLDFNQGLELAFDHSRMVDLSYELLAKNIKENPLPLLMLEGLIPLEDARNVISHFDGSFKEMYLSNFKKVYPTEKFLKETNESPKVKQKGRQVKLYKVNKRSIKNIF